MQQIPQQFLVSQGQLVPLAEQAEDDQQ